MNRWLLLLAILTVPARADEASAPRDEVSAPRDDPGQNSALSIKGGYLNSIPSYGLEYGRFLDERWEASCQYLRGSMRIEQESSGVKGKAELGFQRLLGRARRYFGSTFNVGADIEFRRVAYSIDIGKDSLSGRVITESTSRTLLVGLNAGNRWMFGDHFVLWADWFGVNFSLISADSVSTATEGAATADFDKFQRDNEDLAHKVGASPSIGLLILGIGGRF